MHSCALCSAPTILIKELGPTPIANEFPVDPEKQELFPLNLMQCSYCSHLQLDTEIPKERLFTASYIFASNTGPSNQEYFRLYAREIQSTYNPEIIVDIGSNDGLFLSFFDRSKCQCLGIDPAATGPYQHINSFFTEELASKINFKADVITCNNMLAHNRDLSEILKGVKVLLAPEGTFIFEVSYALSMLENRAFDLVYHEHYHHWHLSPMIAFFEGFGLTIIDAELKDTHGGSIRVFATHSPEISNRSQNSKQSRQLKLALSFEKEVFQARVDAFSNYVQRTDSDILNYLIKDGKTVSILGYPAKACTTSYFWDLGPNYITAIYDDNPNKVGKLSHKGFRIKPTSDIALDKPDYLLILSWNYTTQLIQKHQNFGGKFILPFPELRVIE